MQQTLQQNEFITIIVSLGGFGTSVLTKLYSKTTEEIRNIPTHVNLLAFDSAIQERLNFFPFYIDFLTNVNLTGEEFADDCKKEIDGFDLYWPGLWLNRTERYEKIGPFSNKGLGQYRPKGFLGFLYHLREAQVDIINHVWNSFQNTARVSNKNIDTVTPRVILVNSLAGGTGCGCFLDIAYLIRDKFFQNNKKNLELLLISLTGDASMLGLVKSENDKNYSWALANSYAALWELSYWSQGGILFQKNYPRFPINTKVFPFNHIILVTKETLDGKNLSNRDEYSKFLCDFLYETVIRRTSAVTFSTVFDNILQHKILFGSIGLGYLLYRKKDISSYLFNLLMQDYIGYFIAQEDIRQIAMQINSDIINNLKLQDGNYLSPNGEYDDLRKDDVFALLEQPYADDSGTIHAFPQKATLGGVTAKPSSESVGKLLGYIQGEDDRITKHLESRVDAVSQFLKDQLNKTIRDHMKKKGIAFTHGYLSNLIAIVEAYKKNLQDFRPNQWAPKYEELKKKFSETGGELTKDPKNKTRIQEFARAYDQFFRANNILRLLEKKDLIYQGYFQYLTNWKHAINLVHDLVKKDKKQEIQTKIQNYENENTSHYEKNIFTIPVLSLKNYKRFYQSIYEKIAGNNPKDLASNPLFQALFSNFQSGLFSLVNDDIPGIGQIIERYTNNKPLIAQERSIIEENIDKLLSNLENDEFMACLKGKKVVPESIFEALYKEWENEKYEGNKISFKDFFTLKIKLLQKQVNPFVRLESKQNTTQSEYWLASSKDLDKLFTDHDKDDDLQKNKDDIIKMITTVEDSSNIPGERISLFTHLWGFNIDSLSDYKKVFKLAFENEKVYETFVDLRYRPGGEVKEVIFLMAEYHKIIEKALDINNNETGIYRFDGEVLQEKLKGRGKVLDWFKNDRDPKKNAEMKAKLRDKWAAIPPKDREQGFEDIKESLEKIKRNPKLSKDLREIYKKNIEAMKKAIDQKVYLFIDKELG